jgi:osmotically-inducible protein OsmY
MGPSTMREGSVKKMSLFHRSVASGLAVGCFGLFAGDASASSRANDAAIQEKVAAAISENAALGNSEIEVESVKDGVVFLSGRATDLGDHLEAARVAAAVPGVRHISTRICSPDTVSDLMTDLRADSALADVLADLGASAGSSAGDAWLTKTVRSKLLASGGQPASQVTVDASGGGVTLLGKVESPEDKAAAEEEACRVAGVESVRSLLRVEPREDNEMARWIAEQSPVRDRLQRQARAD